MRAIAPAPLGVRDCGPDRATGCIRHQLQVHWGAARFRVVLQPPPPPPRAAPPPPPFCCARAGRERSKAREKINKGEKIFTNFFTRSSECSHRSFTSFVYIVLTRDPLDPRRSQTLPRGFSSVQQRPSSRLYSHCSIRGRRAIKSMRQFCSPSMSTVTRASCNPPFPVMPGPCNRFRRNSLSS